MSEEVAEEEIHAAMAAAKKQPKASGFTGWLHGILDGLMKRLAKTLRSFVAFAMAMFFLGTLYGVFMPHIVSRVGIEQNVLIALPIILAVLAYYSTEIAALIFILLLGVFLVTFL